MKRRSLLITLLSLVTIATAAAYFFKTAKYAIGENVSVKCMYMAYACGDCYPQYNVRDVSPLSLKKQLLKKDIDIEFASEGQEEEFKKNVGICGICYMYDFKGHLFYSKKKKCFVIKLDDYKLKLKDKKCCEY